MSLRRKLSFFTISLFLFPIIAAAQNDTVSIFRISVIVAFLGGSVSFLSPCTGAILPAFFAYSFKEKKNLLKMTLLFSLGLSLMLIPLGLGATSLGKLFTSYRFQITAIAGLILILFGLFELLGKNIPVPNLINRTSKSSSNPFRVFIFGLAFGTGTIPCAGPILGAILTLAAVSATFLNGLILMIVYTLGIVTPLFVISYFFDKYNLGNSKFFTSGEIKLKLAGLEYKTHWTKLASGVIFIGLGILFIFYGGTSIISNSNPFGILNFFFDLQDNLFGLDEFIPSYTIYLLIAIVLLALLYIYRNKIAKVVKIKAQ